MVQPMLGLRGELLARLDTEADGLDTPSRLRIEAVARTLTRRGEAMVEGWRSMLRSLSAETPAEYVDWMAIERIEGRDLDIGLHRHWIDPTVPFAATVGKAAHGLVVHGSEERRVGKECGRTGRHRGGPEE